MIPQSREICGQTPNIRLRNSQGNMQGPIVHVGFPCPTGNFGVVDGAFPPAPVGGWPSPVNPSTRRKGQWAKRRHIGERLYARVDPNGPEMRPGLGRCWVWTGPRTGQARMHGQIAWRDRYASPQKVHRVAWELWRGPIPVGQQVNHHCDNGVCVRLDHLYLGTQAENLRDASERGRLHVPRVSTLTPTEREAIYALPGYRGIVRDLALAYGVEKSTISRIRRGGFVRVSHRSEQYPQGLAAELGDGLGVLDAPDRAGQFVSE
jgi:hypothetical protein